MAEDIVKSLEEKKAAFDELFKEADKEWAAIGVGKSIMKEQKDTKKIEETKINELTGEDKRVSDETMQGKTGEPEIAKPIKEPIVEPEPIVKKEELPAIPETEKNEELEKSKQEKDQMQKEYAEIDYKETRLWKNVFSYFGDKLRRGDRKENSDVLYMRAAYENKLFDYKNAWINDLKLRSLKGENLQKEIAKLEKYFDFDEKENLYNARTKAKEEYLNQNKSFSHSIALTMLKYNNWYNKQSKLLKIGVGVGLWASGLGLLQAGRRLAMAPITGMATAQTLDLVEKIGDEWIAKRKAKKTGEKFEDVDLAWENFSKSLEKSLFQVNDRFQNRKWRKVFNVAAGTAVGLIASASAIDKFRDWMGWNPADHSGITKEAVTKGVQKGQDIAPRMPEGAPGTGQGHDLAGKATGHAAEKAIGETFEITGHGHGTSLEGRLIDHLKDSGMDPDEAGRKAHLMAQDYAHAHGLKEGSLIHEGTKITLDPTGEHIANINDPHFGDLPEKNIAHTEDVKPIEHPASETQQEVTAETTEPVNIPKTQDQFANVENTYRNHITEQLDKNTEAMKLSNDEPLSRSESPFTKWDYDKYLNGKQRDLIGMVFKANGVNDNIRDAMKLVSHGNLETWHDVKNLTVNQMLNTDDHSMGENIDKAKERFIRFYGAAVEAIKAKGGNIPGKEEKLSTWVGNAVYRIKN